MIVYKNVAYEFNWALWNEVISKLVDTYGLEFVAGYIGVHTATVWSWMRETSAYTDFKYPNMTNFLKVITECDKNPAEFFTTGE